MYLIFDTETSNFRNKQLPLDNPNQGRVIQLAAILVDQHLKEITTLKTLIKPAGWIISPGAQSAHNISQDMCEEYGIPIKCALDVFGNMLTKADIVVGHNIPFDIEMLDTEAFLSNSIMFSWKKSICTMRTTTDICKLKGKIPGKFKWPKLSEAYEYLFKEKIENAHDALIDVRATFRIFTWLKNSNTIAI